MNVTKRTQQGMTGLMFRKPVKVELPPAIDYLLEDTDGSGNTLDQQMRSVTKNVIAIGRHGLLADFPATERATTSEQVANGSRAYIASYQGDNVINWRCEMINGRKKLTLVVLREYVEVQTGEFEVEKRAIYRVLKLVDGLYVQCLYLMDEDETIEYIEPRDGSGQRMDYIPFCFVGAEDNDETIDHPPRS